MTEPESRSAEPQILDQLGPYKNHPPVEIGCILSETAFKRYHQLTDRVARPSGALQEQTPPRLMYIAEAVSTGLRLNATWGLSFPAMSLARDRYEQVVRFSWLTRMNDPWQWKQYAATYYTKWRKLYAAMSPAQRAEFDKISPPPPGWMTETATAEQRKAMERYKSLSLADMAHQRDKLPAVGSSLVDKATLSDLHSSVYVHYSSVSHYDFYAVRLLDLFKNRDGDYVLAVEPYWPAMLVLQNALFDIVQCREATAAVSGRDDVTAFEEMYSIWDDTIHRGGLSKEDYERAKHVELTDGSISMSSTGSSRSKSSLRCMSCGREEGSGPNGVEVVSYLGAEWCARCARVFETSSGAVGVHQPSPGRMSRSDVTDPLDAWRDCYALKPKHRMLKADAKREIQRAWALWDGNKASGEPTFEFFLWLQRFRPYFLTFRTRGDPWQTVHSWLLEYENN